MRRLSREVVRMRIAIALTVQRKSVQRAAGASDPRMREELADELTRRIMGRHESEAVILVPDLVGPALSPSHGKWDEDEPHPAPDVPLADH